MASNKRAVVITGCSKGGLGDALAQALHKNSSFRVIATARNAAKMSHLKELGIETLLLDVQSKESISKCVADVSSMTNGKLHMLVNNSGGGQKMPVMDVDIEAAKELFDLNVWALLAVSQAFLPLLMAAKGMIVNQTSVVASLNVPLQGIYNSSKAAASMLSDTMRIELAPFGIKVIDLRTAEVHSGFFDNIAKTGPQLPEASVYKIAQTEIQQKLTDGHPSSAMQSNEWAEAVAKELNKSTPPPKIWKGGRAGISWFISSFLPVRTLDRILSPMGALDVVQKKVTENRNATGS